MTTETDIPRAPSQLPTKESVQVAFPNAAAARNLDRATEKALKDILERLVAQARKDVSLAPAAKPPSEEDDETMETIILSPGGLRAHSTPPLPGEELCETYLQPRAPRGCETEASPREGASDCTLETMLGAAQKAADDVVQETILAARSRPLPHHLQAPTSALTASAANEHAPTREEMPASRGPGPVSVQAEAEQIGETVCIQPPGGRRPRG